LLRGYGIHTCRSGGRPHRPDAVKPLRGCSATLRPFGWRRRSDVAILLPWSLLRDAGAKGRRRAATIMETESLSRAEGSRLSSAARNRRSRPGL